MKSLREEVKIQERDRYSQGLLIMRDFTLNVKISQGTPLVVP